MKKLFCMIALAAITSGTVFAAMPVRHVKTMQTDSVKKKKKVKNGKVKLKVKKDTAKMH